MSITGHVELKVTFNAGNIFISYEYSLSSASVHLYSIIERVCLSLFLMNIRYRACMVK